MLPVLCPWRDWCRLGQVWEKRSACSLLPPLLAPCGVAERAQEGLASFEGSEPHLDFNAFFIRSVISVHLGLPLVWHVPPRPGLDTGSGWAAVSCGNVQAALASGIPREHPCLGLVEELWLTPPESVLINHGAYTEFGGPLKTHLCRVLDWGVWISFRVSVFLCLGLYLFSAMDKGLASDLQLMNHGAPAPNTHCRGGRCHSPEGEGRGLGPKSDRGSVLLQPVRSKP